MPLMRVILFVAGGAGCRKLVTIKVALVAGIALDPPVFAAECKLCLPVMVETDHIPFLRAMAVITFRAIAPAMYVLQLMANAANGADVLIELAGMTSFAGDFFMRTAQLE